MTGTQTTSEEEPLAVEGKGTLFTRYTVGIVTEFPDRLISVYIYVH